MPRATTSAKRWAEGRPCVSSVRERFLQPREGLLSLGLLAVMLVSLTWAVQSAGWLEKLDFLLPVALVGALLGAILGLSTLRVVLTLPIGAVAGATLVIWTVGGEYLANQSQLSRLVGLHEDLVTWLAVVARRGYPTQLSPYALGLGVVMFAIAFMAAYALYRHHRALDAILLVGAALIANMSATFADLFGYLVIFVLAALLLWLRAALITRQEGWTSRRVNENQEVPASIMRSGVMFIGVSIILAWVLTSVAVAAPLTVVWRNLDTVWSDVRDRFDGVFGNLTNPKSRISGTSFGSKFTVSGTWFSNNDPVMTVGSTRAYYLRTVTYDVYTGHGWDSTPGRERQVDSARPVFPGVSPERPVVGQAFDLETITVRFDHAIGPNLYTPGFPTKFFAPVLVTEPGGRPMLGRVKAANGLGDGEGYSVTAAISKATEAQLAHAGQAYPADIQRLYLDTEGVTDRTRRLARQIADLAGATDAYHQARALATFLSSDPSFRYATSVPSPDPSRDLVDQFLFDPNIGREGYCQYYASAMVMMARSLGLPARMAVGFAPGERLRENQYQYRESNAHAWAEIYFPGYGWQIFEATKSINPQFARLTGDATRLPPPVNGTEDRKGPFDANIDSPSKLSTLPSMRPIPGGIQPGQQDSGTAGDPRTGNGWIFLIVLAVGALVVVWRLGRAGRRIGVMPPVDRHWARLRLAASRAGVAQRPSETYYEYAGWLEEQIPSRAPEIRTIAAAKVWKSYSGRSIGDEALAGIERAWRRLRLPLVWLAARRRAQRLARRDIRP
ncbi:MAG: hypothetical protein DLM71_02825 [Chloroflexi bacterium]|nr:MAG: hypothetical protein DLM71_02825 [Chloroflexota bacterium]